MPVLLLLTLTQSTHLNPPRPDTGFDQSYETWDPDAYSNGPLEIGFQGFVPKTSVGFIHACEAANIPIVEELNSGNGTGVKQGTGILDSRYRRSSSYDAFYKQASNRTNLNVLFNSPVSKIVFDDTDGTPKATGVQFTDESTSLVYRVHAKKEVIVSMGAFQSPQLLMISVSLE
jgi:choline dehydrogenase